MENNRSFDKSSLIAAAIVSLLAFFAYFYQDEVMHYVRKILEGNYLRSCMILIILVVVITHSLKGKSQNSSNGFSIKIGLLPLDIFLTCSTYIAVSSTACSLLKGAFIQQFFGDEVYFTQFGQLDIYVLLGVSALLIWYVVFHMYLLALELFYPVQGSSTRQNSIEIT